MIDLLLGRISEENWEEFKTGFLAYCPVPLDKDDNPTMTEAAHIKKTLREIALLYYRRGKETLALKAAEVKKNLIE